MFAVLLGICLFSASNANAQRVVFGVGFGPAYYGPAYYGPAPVCAYGYYDYYPYACAPYGYYGPDWFVGRVFIGAGPWFHGFHDRDFRFGRRGFGGFRGSGFDHRGFFHQNRGGSFNRGFHGGNNFRGGGSGRGFHGGGEFHGGGGHGGGHR